MKVLILGGDGMLGHTLFLNYQKEFDVRVTIRENLEKYKHLDLFNSSNTYDGVDIVDISSLQNVISDFNPDVIINTIGIVKQRNESKDIELSLLVNSLFPHKLSHICNCSNIRLIHISTDCIFSGNIGAYDESILPDAEDVYGKTKYIGEVKTENCLTLRTSFIGRELKNKKSILEWFIAQQGDIFGYKEFIYSGLTTIELANIIKVIIADFPSMSGLYHVSSHPINKHALLCMLKEKLNKNDVQIHESSEVVCDRSLDSHRFKLATNYSVPKWEQMLDDYILWLKHNAHNNYQ